MNPSAGPTPVVPTPAATFTQLRGRRVIIGVSGIGFRADLRADDPLLQGGRTFVPVLPEHDFYRSELEQIETFAPLVPIDRVWVEDHRPSPAPSITTLDAPVTRQAVAVRHSNNLTGRRIVQAVADGFVRDLRAMSEAYENALGLLSLRVCAESDWYTWAFTGTTPTSIEVNANASWVE